MAAIEPRISYCTREDGVSLAYAIIGESGPTIVMIPGWISHLRNLWRGRGWRSFLEPLAERFRVVTYDKHGTGLSDRDRTEFTLESEVRDVETIVDHLCLDRFSLFGFSEGGPSAITYAVEHADRVERLLLYASFCRGSTLSTPEFQAAFMSLVEASWGFASQAFTDLVAPGAEAELVEYYAQAQRDAASREVAVGLLRQIYAADVHALLPAISMPTLILHRERDRLVPMRCGREIAAGIPHARFVPLEGNQHIVGLGDAGAFVQEIFDFHGETRPAPASAAAPAGALQIILFTDLAGSTAMQSRLGDADARDVLRTHDAAVRTAVAEHRGREVKHTGDGMMTAFGSAADAVQCALAVKREIAIYNDAHPGEELLVRFGLNAGEPIAEDDDLFGLSVSLAARIGDWGEPGQVLCSNVVRELLLGKGFAFTAMGRAELKGIDEPVPLYEVT